MSDRSPDESAASDGVENRPQSDGEDKGQEKDNGKQGTTGKQYKVFVGNMPYSANNDSLKHFFKCVKDELVSIRPLTDKKSGQSRGCAFVEFNTSEAMQKALAMTGSELNGRKLRIEPSAAGGGKSAKRMQRINKNKKLVEREEEKYSDSGEVDLTPTSIEFHNLARFRIKEKIKKKRKVWATKKKSENEEKAASQSTLPT